MVGLSKSKTITGYQIYLSFFIAQHIRDELLMESLIGYLGCGKLTSMLAMYVVLAIDAQGPRAVQLASCGGGGLQTGGTRFWFD